jgi:hypothetical protein
MRTYQALLATLLLSVAGFAQNITGTATNGTSGKAASGLDVALVDPMQGMAEVATAKSAADGTFTFKLNGPAQGPRLVRVTKDGVNYFKMVTPGTTSVSVQVYDAAKSLSGISGTANVMRIQADNSSLHVLELFAVKNESNPPRTLQTDNTFEFVLPDNAKLDGADAQGPGGQPIQVTPTALKQKGHYAYSYALKPGETRFQLGYSIPYSGSAKISPKLTTDFEHFVVVLPATMKWEAKNSDLFRPMQDQPGTTVEVSSAAKKQSDLSFSVSGIGAFAEDQAQDAQAGTPPAGGQQADNRPGGGLGAPIDAPDALEKYRWPLLGILGVVLCGGAYLAVSRGKPSLMGVPAPEVPRANTVAPTVAEGQAPASRPGNALLDAMKEELFELEMDRQTGAISEADYIKNRATLEQTLALAVARSKRTTNA